MKETYWVLVYINETPFDVAKYKSFFVEEQSITKETLKRWKETLLRYGRKNRSFPHRKSRRNAAFHKVSG